MTDTPTADTIAPITGQRSIAQGRGLSDRVARLVDATYRSLVERTEPSGYAVTSLTGHYTGMFARDGSIQALALLEAGDAVLARSVLSYLIGYGMFGGVERVPRVVLDPTYRAGEDAVTVVTAHSQLNDITPVYAIQGPGFAAAQSFRAPSHELRDVWLPIGAQARAGALTVSVRRDPEDAATEVAAGTIELDQTTVWPSWVCIPLALASGQAVVEGERLWLHLQADVDGPDAAVHVHGNLGPAGPAGASRRFDTARGTGWSDEPFSIAFAVNADSDPGAHRGVAFPQPPAEPLAALRTGEPGEHAFDGPSTLSALDVFVSGPTGVADLVVELSDATGRGVSVVVPASSLEPTGRWHRLEFTTLGRGGTGRYLLRATTDADGIRLHGRDGAPALQPLRLDYSATDMSNQPDATFMLVQAWARYVAAQPDDAVFFADMIDTVAAWADYYLTADYLDDDLQLLFNPEFEHSRRPYFIPVFDLITNVFAAHALGELADLTAGLAGFAERSREWAARAAWLTEGIDAHLTTLVDLGSGPRRVYAEMLWSSGGKDDERTLVEGFSWMNLAPAAAGWRATDERMLRDTYLAHLALASTPWTGPGDGVVDTMLKTCGWRDSRDDAVVGKGVGFELLLASRLGMRDRLATIAHFLEQHTRTELFPEQYLLDGWADEGNQEQASWFILGVLEAFPCP